MKHQKSWHSCLKSRVNFNMELKKSGWSVKRFGWPVYALSNVNKSWASSGISMAAAYSPVHNFLKALREPHFHFEKRTCYLTKTQIQNCSKRRGLSWAVGRLPNSVESLRQAPPPGQMTSRRANRQRISVWTLISWAFNGFKWQLYKFVSGRAFVIANLEFQQELQTVGRQVSSRLFHFCTVCVCVCVFFSNRFKAFGRERTVVYVCWHPVVSKEVSIQQRSELALCSWHY